MSLVGARSRAVAWAFVALVVVPVAFAPAFAADPDRADDGHRLEAPSVRFPAGTDELGRCVASRVLHGGRTSLALAGAVVALAAGVGLLAGAAGASLGRWADAAVVGATDLLLVVPSFVLALVAVGVAGASPPVLVAVLALVELPVYARVARAAVRAQARAAWVLADRALGIPRWRTWWHGLLPAAVAPVAATAVARIGRTLLALAGLGFLGLGVPPPTAEWGAMVAAGRTFLRVAPWVVLAPGLGVVVATLAASTVAAGLARRLGPAHGDDGP
ncbi:MAG: ABC transporter permease subunit [Planctomycetes bacterium]|nr:ABC transporter permease subunit [Planctomycetota bacterium]